MSASVLLFPQTCIVLSINVVSSTLLHPQTHTGLALSSSHQGYAFTVVILTKFHQSFSAVLKRTREEKKDFFLGHNPQGLTGCSLLHIVQVVTET